MPSGHLVDADVVPSLRRRNFQGTRARKWRLQQTHMKLFLYLSPFEQAASLETRPGRLE